MTDAILVALIVALSGGYLILCARRFWRRMRGDNVACGGCGGAAKRPAALVQVELVQVESLSQRPPG